MRLKNIKKRKNVLFFLHYKFPWIILNKQLCIFLFRQGQGDILERQITYNFVLKALKNVIDGSKMIITLFVGYLVKTVGSTWIFTTFLYINEHIFPLSPLRMFLYFWVGLDVDYGYFSLSLNKILLKKYKKEINNEF